MTIGSGRDVDITVQGTGVEPLHCHIDNANGVVTLHPIAEMTSVDGLKVTSATRLTQGQYRYPTPLGFASVAAQCIMVPGARVYTVCRATLFYLTNILRYFLCADASSMNLNR